MTASAEDLEAFFLEMVQNGVEHREMASIARDIESFHLRNSLPNEYLQALLWLINEASNDD